MPSDLFIMRHMVIHKVLLRLLPGFQRLRTTIINLVIRLVKGIDRTIHLLDGFIEVVDILLRTAAG